MRSALNLLFWGYLFVFLRLEIVIDVLPDPIGYLLIALGCYKLQEKYPIAKRAGVLSTIMIFIAIPTFFVDVGKEVGLGWSTYSIALMILKLILIYFVFSILKEIAKSYDNEALSKRTHNTFITYMSVNLILLAFLSFSMNIPESPLLSFSFILMIAAFIMEIVFLVLIRAIRQAKPIQLALDFRV